MKKNLIRAEIEQQINLGRQLKKIRHMTNLTMSDLAMRLKVAPSQISIWEKGETEVGTFGLIALANVYGLSLDKLVGREELTRDDVFELYMRFC